jgi:hypothetical protein
MGKTQTETKHTPGDWEYRYDRGMDRHYVAVGIYCIVESVWGTIEADDAASRKANAAEREANARLMSAASDMLGALEDLLGDQPWLQNGSCVHCGRTYDAAPEHCCDDCPGEIGRAAIRKARGAA